ncbi:MAG: methylated-DNA--[protein]-cysteine S-methyltransferase [bacterium]|nr:methylated-DNA--[protein]-cysteine S-methyltransferase [bacterium]
MERAVRDRDRSYDGVFYLGVRTTGIFCRPSCSARKPRPRNVECFGSTREALLAGYRPCKRCRPMDANGRPPQWVTKLLDLVERHPTERLADADLRQAAIDPSRARRFFKQHYGMTFQAYHRTRRMGLALAEIHRGADLTGVALAHGFDSNSGFRAAFERTFGRTPGRAHDSNVAVTARLESPLGLLLAGATSQGLCLLEFADRPALETQLTTLSRRLDCTVVPGSNTHIDLVRDELGGYFAGRLTEFTVPLVVSGTPFQETVWARLQRIPYGQTTSYGRLAKAIGHPGAQRAVGRANGANRIAIIIPCHRVVQSDGQLRGYGGGLWRKQHLLDLERAVAAGGDRNQGGIVTAPVQLPA